MAAEAHWVIERGFACETAARLNYKRRPTRHGGSWRFLSTRNRHPNTKRYGQQCAECRGRWHSREHVRRRRWSNAKPSCLWKRPDSVARFWKNIWLAPTSNSRRQLPHKRFPCPNFLSHRQSQYICLPTFSNNIVVHPSEENLNDRAT